MTPTEHPPQPTPEPEPSQGGRRRLAGASRAARRAVAPFSHEGFPRLAGAMLSAFTARPIIELKQQTKAKIETILAHGAFISLIPCFV